METFSSGGTTVKVSVYNLSSQDITEGEISLLKLGTKFVPATLVPEEDTKVDILRFSRKLLLKTRFHESDFIDNSIVKPKSCYIPKAVKSQVLKGIVEDLEVFANEFPKNMETRDVVDNLTVDQRVALKVFRKETDYYFLRLTKELVVFSSMSYFINIMFYNCWKLTNMKS